MTLISGYELRLARPDDVPAAARFVIRYDLQVGGYNDMTEEDLAEMTRQRGFEFGRDAWLAEKEGEVVAYAMVWPRGDSFLHSFGAVDLRHRGNGLGSWLLDRVEERAYGAALDRTVTLRCFVDLKDEPGVRLLAGRGYEFVRRHWTMHRPLPAGDPPVPPPGVEIRTPGRANLELIHGLLQEAFSEHWGFVATSFEDWVEELPKRSDTDPGLWYVAYDDGEPVGALLATTDGRLGWVADLGVLKAARGRGVARALLWAAFAEFERRGCVEAGLGVDSGNETGAVALYESVGMAPIRQYDTLEKAISAAPA